MDRMPDFTFQTFVGLLIFWAFCYTMAAILGFAIRLMLKPEPDSTSTRPKGE